MLLETSMARMIVARLEGIVIVAVGRARAKTRLVRADKNRTNGRCLLNHD
jgi:hypothetical protein